MLLKLNLLEHYGCNNASGTFTKTKRPVKILKYISGRGTGWDA
jgi:hypothetical protein